MELSINQNNVPSIDYKGKAVEYLQGMGMNIPQKYASQFIELAQAFQLNPFKREIYAVGYGENWNIITGYEVYIKRAERSGKLDGWNVKVEGNGENSKAKITIYRKDWKYPFEHEVLFQEAAKKNKDGSLSATWRQMPHFMLKKVAIGQGFRLCFSDDFGGMPYEESELPPIEKQQQQELKSANIDDGNDIDVYCELQTLINQYAVQLDGEPLNLAKNALETGSENEIKQMTERVKSYLAKKRVAG